jgi:hypothetical protein
MNGRAALATYFLLALVSDTRAHGTAEPAGLQHIQKYILCIEIKPVLAYLC